MQAAAAIRLILTVIHSAVFATAKPTPPLQHANGPGGADYVHGALIQSQHGDDLTGYWLFEPASPTPASAPVIIFMHGWSAMEPRPYGAWIKHLVRRGNIVIYPRYQDSLLTPMPTFTPNTLTALRDAFARLQDGTHVRPDLDRVAVVGHSMGAAITANIAAHATAERLPQPKAIMLVQPGNQVNGYPQLNMPLAELALIPPATLMLVIVGDDDSVVGTKVGEVIYRGVPQIPVANKNFILMLSDDHGAPPLKANHFAPLAPDPAIGENRRFRAGTVFSLASRTLSGVDALDYYGFWKLFDALTDAAFFNKNRHMALGNTPEQRFMGKWSDGVPVRELVVRDEP